MKPGVFLGVGAFGILFFTFYSSRAQATTSFSVVLSEISTAGIVASDEFIELYNPGDTPFSLSGWQLRRRTESGTENSLKVFGKDAIIPAHGYYLWSNSRGLFASPLADTETTSSLSDNNSLALYTSSGVDGSLVDSVSWGSGSSFSFDTPRFSNPPKKSSLVRDTTSFLWSTSDALTPTNSYGVTWTPAPPESEPISPGTQSLPTIRFNELYANPAGEESAEEFIELYNPTPTSTDLSGCRIHDASKSGEYTFPAGTIVDGNTYLVLKRNVSKISLNNGTETLSLFESSGVLIDSVAYIKTREGISYNYNGQSWRGGTPTPGAENDINALPETSEKVPKKGYRGFTVLFDARGSDVDNDALKYMWDFGDGHKSYRGATSHKYQGNGSYIVTLTTSDGQDDILETFPLEIVTFPKPDVRIIKLVPNPTGIDSEHEFLVIENRGKKPVDLKDFSIATGWKKLANHPVREKFVIPPGTTKKLTRDVSLFTLPNQKGKIELRLPDGTALQTIKYKLPQSAAEDAVYQKEKGKRWQWHEVVRENPSTSVAPTSTEETDAPEQQETAPKLLPSSDETSPLPEPTDVTENKQVLGAETLVDETYIPELPLAETSPVTLPPFTSLKTFLQMINEFFNRWQNDHP